MELLVLLAADYANRTDKGKANVMGIFNSIHASKFPARHPEMYLIARFSASPAEYNMKRTITVKLLDEDAREELVNWSQEIVVPQGAGGHRVEPQLFLRLTDIIFPRPGNYMFYILVGDDPKGTLPLYVFQETQPAGA